VEPLCTAGFPVHACNSRNFESRAVKPRHPTGRAPRSLAEAFGPYTRADFTDPPISLWRRLLRALFPRSTT